MSITFPPQQWKPEDTSGNHPRQGELRIHAEAPPPKVMQLLPASVLVGATCTQVLQYAAMYSGMDQEQLSKRVLISKSYMTKFLNGVGQAWARRFVKFMLETGCLGPLQWIADQVGCELVVRDSRAAELASLKARLNELERAA